MSKIDNRLDYMHNNMTPRALPPSNASHYSICSDSHKDCLVTERCTYREGMEFFLVSQIKLHVVCTRALLAGSPYGSIVQYILVHFCSGVDSRAH